MIAFLIFAAAFLVLLYGVLLFGRSVVETIVGMANFAVQPPVKPRKHPKVVF